MPSPAADFDSSGGSSGNPFATQMPPVSRIDAGDQIVRREQIRIVYDQALPAFVGGVAATLIFVWIFRDVTNVDVLLPWCVAQLFMYALRAALSFLFKRRVNAESVDPWARAHLTGTLATASLWGAIWILFVDAAEPLYVVTAMLWTLGLGASAVGAYSVHFPTFIAFYVPVVAPAFVYMLVAPSTLSTAISLGLIAHAAVLVGAMRRIHGAMLEAIRLNFALGEEIKERQSVESQLRELSERDGLTGLGNRRHFDESLVGEWRRALRDQRPISLALIDIDDFKGFNDRYGHVAGDNCVRRVSAMLNEMINRPGDMAARFGGDEFVLLLPNNDRVSAAAIAETLRAAVEAMSIPHESTSVAETGIVTLSVGVASLIPCASQQAEQLIEDADKALYRAKSTGRNRVAVHGLAIGTGQGGELSHN